VRELWLDRIVLGALLGIATPAAWIVAGKWAAAATACGLAAGFVGYELATPKPDLRTNDSPPDAVERLFGIHDVRAVCMGHTHRPFGEWREGRFWGNSGSWCPAFRDVHCTEPVLDGRPFLHLTSEPNEPLRGGLSWWKNGEIVPAASPMPARPEVRLKSAAAVLE
jgi:hypothetical protein